MCSAAESPGFLGTWCLGPACQGPASRAGSIGYFFNVLCDLSGVKVSPLLPGLNAGKVPGNGSRCSDLGNRHPRSPHLALGPATEQRVHLSLQAPGESAVSSLEGTGSELGLS